MHCPGCGTRASPDQQFCRICGFNLEKVSSLLGEQLPAALSDKAGPGNLAQLLQKQRKIERRLSLALSTFFGIALAAMLVAVAYKVIMEGGHVLPGIMLLSLLLGIALALALVFYRQSMRDTLTKHQLAQPEIAPRVPTAELPEPKERPIPSVTEGTTELLPVEQKAVNRSTEY